MTQAARPGDVLVDRYHLVDLLNESGNGRFWRAHDRVLDRHVALHCIADDDERAAGLTEAARLSATVVDRRMLRVLDADERDGMSYVVNEWGVGTSLDILVTNEGPLPPRRAAWIVSEVAACVAVAHAERVAHGRLSPENVLIDHSGSVRVIGCCVDAALRGLPPGRISQDVTDLGGLLYFALTGKWAGASESAMPPAPRPGGRWLRPRQVRAGIPRVLDTTCDQVLNPFAAAPSGGSYNLHTAAGLAQALHDYVGDPTGLAESAPVNGIRGAGALAVPAPRSVRPAEPDVPERTPPAPSPSAEEEQPGQTPEPEAEPPADDATVATPAVPADPAPSAPPRVVTDPDRPPDRIDQPTQAGMPIFDDEGDEVRWFSARHEPPAPPPPLEEPPARPLFAPEPSDGGPVRRPRPGAAPTGQPDYWPWDTSTSTGTGSGVIPVTEQSADDDEVPGRSWFRLAVLMGASLLLLVAVVVAFNLGRGRTPLGTDPEPDPTPSQSATNQPVEELPVASARDFDPQGGPEFTENPDLVPLAVDGDAATSWRTLTYEQQLGPAGLKTGVGLVLDLGESREVAEIDLSVAGTPVGASFFLTEEDPRGVAELDELATVRLEKQRLRTRLEEPATGRYLVVWLTELPAVDGGFSASVAEVVVRG